MSSSSGEIDIFKNIKSVIDGLLVLLSDKEKHVLINRFDLESRGKLTLDSIGRHFSVTRERVRQIEKNALTKLRRNVFNSGLPALQGKIRDVLESSGLLILETDLFASLIRNDDLAEFNKSSVRLAVVLSEDMRLVGNTISYAPYIVSSSIKSGFVDEVLYKAVKLLTKKNNVMKIVEVHSALKGDFVDNSFFTVEFLKSLFAINKSIKVMKDAVGLLKWRHIHPRTLRDKIYFVLRREQKSLHFVEIANRISERMFDVKTVNQQAVHNELIRHDQFVLIGRGIYALKEWGYDHGTTKDVIVALLKKRKTMSEADIVKRVLEKRQVKPITILLALKNSRKFLRVGRKTYSLKG